MALKSGHKQFNLPLTTAQKQALQDEAARRGISLVQLVRNALAQVVPDFPLDMPTHGGKRDLPELT